MTVAIRLQGVSKQFEMHRERARSFQEAFVNVFRRDNEERHTFWALQDISFSLKQGESLALIGSNGSGKSTLLKVISQILFPTTGEVMVNGRISSLLELGTGFHPDLTGRENVYLNASMLGFSREDIQARFDDIIEFSELGEYIDLPVKHYSSGMYLRLGFSVAIHTDPDILLVDEALSVGDAAFQRKCMTRISNIQKRGVTIVLVSHGLDAVRRVTERTIWLEKGQMIVDGPTDEVIREYTRHSYEQEYERSQEKESVEETPVETVSQARRWGSYELKIERVRLLRDDGRETQFFETDQPLIIALEYVAQTRIEKPVFGLAIHNETGIHLTGPNTFHLGHNVPFIEAGPGQVQFKVPSLALLEGRYLISVAAHNQADSKMFDYHDQLYEFQVMPSSKERYGIISLQGAWYWPGITH